MRAAFALAVSLVMQTVIMGAYLLLREHGQMTAILRHWKPSLAVGVTGFLASVGWFTDVTLQNSAYVSAVGPIELTFPFIPTVIWFKQRPTTPEHKSDKHRRGDAVVTT